MYNIRRIYIQHNDKARVPQSNNIRPMFKLRIYNSGIGIKLILKQRRWAFLADRLIS